MAIFRYKAFNTVGKRITGVVDADTLTFAKEKLQRQGIFVTKLLATAKKELFLKQEFILSFTRELAQLLKAGLPLYESILIIEEKYRRHKLHSFFLDISDKIKNGVALSASLKDYSTSFDQVYITMVQVGEKTGSLSWIFEQLHELISKKQKLKKQLISAAAYPIFLGCFCLFIVFSLLFFVIPLVRDLFEGRTLHPVTQTVLSMSRFLTSHGPFLAITLVAIIAGLLLFFRKGKGKVFIQALLFHLPIVKDLLLQTTLIRFCRCCSILLSGGVPLVQALHLSKENMVHFQMKKSIEGAIKKINEGKKLSSELRKEIFPSLVSKMISIGEETGQLAKSFCNIADIYDLELERNLSGITIFLQPLLLIVIGALVGIIVLSILLPLTDVSSFVEV
ncbi:MAG: type II secretion system F family protein [Chlamydiae bacterium]|nr:type II secretion system F family protein [Chlamydiota bacterium]